MIAPLSPHDPRIGQHPPAPQAPAAAHQSDSFAPSLPDLASMYRANIPVPARSSPSGRQKAVAENGLSVQPKGGQAHQVFAREPQSFQWVDNDRLLVEADGQGDDRSRLYLVRADGSQQQPLGDGSGVEHLCYRTGSDLYFRSDARSPGDFDLLCHDLKSGQTRSVFTGKGDLDYLRALPDGRILASRNDTSTTNSLWLIDPGTGSQRQLGGDGGRLRVLRSLDDRSLLCLSNLGREFSSPCRLDLESGQLKVLADTHRDTDLATFSPSGQKLACLENDQGFSRLCLYDPAGQPLPAPSLPPGVVSQCSFKDDNTLRVAMSCPDSPRREGELNLSTGELHWTRDETIPGAVMPQAIHYPSPDGTSIPALLYMPPHHQADQPLPAVIQLHGGPASQTRPRFDPMIQHLVDQGIAVLTPNVRGSTGSGQSYLEADNGDKRAQAIQDVRGSADYLKKLGVDPQRIALMGASYGGYLTLAALTFLSDDKWAAAVDQSGPSDLTTLLKPNDPDTDEFGRDPKVLSSLSPLPQADRIQAPLMVVHGTHDPVVAKDQSDRLVQALQQEGKQVDYLVLPHEGHLIRDLDTRIQTQGQMADFLTRHLKP